LVTSCVGTAFLKHVIERKKKRIEQRGRRKRRHKHVMDDLKETRGYWK